jgi:hypothetical protein
MMSRKMWAFRGSLDGDLVSSFAPQPEKWMSDPAPFLITSAEGMPDFAPGDRVRAAYTGKQGCVRAVAMVDGGWRVYWRDTGNVCHEYDSAFLTKLPREVTKLVRVTGPERAVAFFCTEGTRSSGVYTGDGLCNVRVEIVEEER